MTERGLKIREIFRAKYGVDHPSQLQSVKDKIKLKRKNGSYDNMTTNLKRTLLKKYGDENYVNVEKIKQTKLEKYGDETYNNREQMLKTNNERYGMNVSLNTLNSTISRSINGELGFKSDKYKQYLATQNLTNISQREDVKQKKSHNRLKQSVHRLFFGDRLKSIVSPNFREDEYLGAEYYTLYQFKCNTCGNIFEDTLYSGNIPRCLVCYPHNRFKSNIESEILDFIKLNETNVKEHDRTILGGNEIDILLPTQKIGIECDGIIWHSEIFGKKDKSYHIGKTNLSETNGISLIHIWDWEWLNKKDIIKSILLHKLGKSVAIYARKCEIKEISPSLKSEFLIKNHIQGNDISSKRIGLYYNAELVSVMTFTKSRFDGNYEYEMSRYCNKINVNIVGGANKMFSYFLRKYNPSSIVSYCDRRYFIGSVYQKLGMSLKSTTPPSHHYFHKNNCIPINRLNFQKYKLKTILKIYDENMTAWQNMQLNGYDRIWDCGHFKYEWVSPHSKISVDNIV